MFFREEYSEKLKPLEKTLATFTKEDSLNKMIYEDCLKVATLDEKNLNLTITKLKNQYGPMKNRVIILK